MVKQMKFEAKPYDYRYKRSRCKKYKYACILLGMIFFLAGLNGFFEFQRVGFSPRGEFFLGYLKANAWLWPMINFIQVVAGLFLILRSYVALALFMLAPIITNIVAFHIALDPTGLPVAAGVLALYLYIGHYFRPFIVRLLKRC
tara:strand:- start:3048 stop:3479 length:432 start_codon:yes stop_codon:yes gene_type:complete